MFTYFTKYLLKTLFVYAYTILFYYSAQFITNNYNVYLNYFGFSFSFLNIPHFPRNFEVEVPPLFPSANHIA